MFQVSAFLRHVAVLWWIIYAVFCIFIIKPPFQNFGTAREDMYIKGWDVATEFLLDYSWDCKGKGRYLSPLAMAKEFVSGPLQKRS